MFNKDINENQAYYDNDMKMKEQQLREFRKNREDSSNNISRTEAPKIKFIWSKMHPEVKKCIEEHELIHYQRN